MREIDKLDYEVWYNAKGDGKSRRICAFHYRFNAEEFIENQHESMRGGYYIKDKSESKFYPNEIF